jgi:hypothetical protein
LDLTGLVSSISDAAFRIDSGRKGFARVGKERAGRIAYEEGIAKALNAFREAQLSADPQAILFAEYSFLSQEFQFCHESDKGTHSSLTQAIQSFDDAFSALDAVENHTVYQGAERTYPHSRKYRVKGFPKDAFHIACMSHKVRLQNITHAPGIDLIEKSLLTQRISNLTTAQSSYVGKQKVALS